MFKKLNRCCCFIFRSRPRYRMQSVRARRSSVEGRVREATSLSRPFWRGSLMTWGVPRRRTLGQLLALLSTFFNYFFFRLPCSLFRDLLCSRVFSCRFPHFLPQSRRSFYYGFFLKEINQNYFFNLKMNIFYKNLMNTETNYLQIQCIYIYIYDTVENTCMNGI